MLARKGFRIANVDATIVAQRPKLAPYFPAMRENLAADLKVAIERVNVKGTTTEGMASPAARKASPPVPSHCSKNNRRGRNRRVWKREHGHFHAVILGLNYRIRSAYFS